MKRLDPTLEAQLIDRVQTKQDSDALIQLATQHSGIYQQVVNRYAQAYPTQIRAGDLTDDRLRNIWEFVRKYDGSRGAMLSTYIHDRTNYLCLSLLRNDCKKDPLLGAVQLSSGAPQNDADGSSSSPDVTVPDETQDVVEAVDRSMKLDDIIETARQICSDQRFLSILQYRHFNTVGSELSMSWRQIGKMLNLSHEMVRKIYNVNLVLVKKEMKRNGKI